jgi:hypothetical protein
MTVLEESDITSRLAVAQQPLMALLPKIATRLRAMNPMNPMIHDSNGVKTPRRKGDRSGRLETGKESSFLAYAIDMTLNLEADSLRIGQFQSNQAAGEPILWIDPWNSRKMAAPQ